MSKGRASLSELMGKSGASLAGKKLTMEHLPHILGEAMPHMPLDAIGKHRLITALTQRFGLGFRNIPGVTDIISDFDGRVEHEKLIQRLKAHKAPQKKEKK